MALTLHNLHNNPYCVETIPLWEIIYGPNLISLGSTAAIENMFSDLAIYNLRALDLGFGIGGVAYYLAEHYRMTIAGVEAQPWMAQYAQTHAPHNLAQQLKFTTYNAEGKIPFEKETFDLVYSKGVLNHVKDKLPLLRQVAQVLKPQGQFVIADWIYPENTERKNDPSSPMTYETQSSYQDILKGAGFNDVKFRNDSQAFLSYVASFLENLKNRKRDIEENFGEDVYVALMEQHEALYNEITKGEKIATRIKCRVD